MNLYNDKSHCDDSLVLKAIAFLNDDPNLNDSIITGWKCQKF